MASNLSSLISDAFTIYSEAYTKIGVLGNQIAQLDSSPRQPDKLQQLTFATRLYRVIEPSITLNDAGTAIIKVVGQISVINNLLLKLKRVMRLYNLPAFPTPLIDYVFNLGEGGADVDATYVTINTEAGLPQSRRVAVGVGLSLTDGGALGQVTLTNTSALSSLEVDTTVNPVLNIAGLIERLFYGSTAINGLRTWSLLNSTSARRIQVLFSITGLTPGDSTHDQTLWANTMIYTISGSTPSAGVWRPIEDGQYEMEATTYDGVNWRVKIF